MSTSGRDTTESDTTESEPSTSYRSISEPSTNDRTTDTIEAVLFDLDHTLCEYTQPPESLLETAFERSGTDALFPIEDYYALYDDYLTETETATELRERCFTELAERYGYDGDLGRTVATAYDALRDYRDVRPLPGCETVLETLGSTHPLGLVTNGGPETQDVKLDVLGIADVFDVIVYAGYDTPAKPAPEPFFTALDALCVSPENAVHVGDSLSSDVAGAQNAGVRSIWMKRDTDVKESEVSPDFVIDTLEALERPPWTRSR